MAFIRTVPPSEAQGPSSPTFPFGPMSWPRLRPPVRYEARTARWRTAVCSRARCSMPRQ